MKIMVISDIHGSLHATKRLLEIYKQEEAKQLIILGDVMYHGPRNPLPPGYDPLQVSIELNKMADRIIGVAGNCDAPIDLALLKYDICIDKRIETFNDRTFFMTHGDRYNPSHHPVLSPKTLFLSGHTHVLEAEYREGIYYLNPGSPSLPKEGMPPSYAVVTESGVTIYDLDQNIIKELKFED